jgi:hypothetical protein
VRKIVSVAQSGLWSESDVYEFIAGFVLKITRIESERYPTVRSRDRRKPVQVATGAPACPSPWNGEVFKTPDARKTEDARLEFEQSKNSRRFRGG